MLLEIIWLDKIIRYILPMVLLHKYFSKRLSIYFKKCLSLFRKPFLIEKALFKLPDYHPTFYSHFFKKWSHSTEKKGYLTEKKVISRWRKGFLKKKGFLLFGIRWCKKKEKKCFSTNPYFALFYFWTFAQCDRATFLLKVNNFILVVAILHLS